MIITAPMTTAGLLPRKSFSERVADSASLWVSPGMVLSPQSAQMVTDMLSYAPFTRESGQGCATSALRAKD